MKRMSFGLLAVTGVLLSASAAQAASFSFGDKATIALFRGAGGLLGSSERVGSSGSGRGESGIDILAARINRSLSDYALTTQVFDSYEGSVFDFREVGSDRATPFLNALPESTPIGLVGYSAGGLSAIRTAKKRADKPVSLLVQIDSYEPLTGQSNEDEVLPSNVQTGLNYYQSRNRFNVFGRGWDPSDLQGATNVRGSENINAEELFGDRSLTHRRIIQDANVQNRIVQDIQENLLDGLTFDRSGKLTLGQGAEAIRNIVRLTPSGQSRAADATLAESISSDSSFQSRLEFRLPFETLSEGLAFWVGPSAQPEADDDSLTLKFDPLLPSESIQSNKLLLLTPGQGADSENAPFSLNGSDPVTAWVDYDSDRKRYEVFISDTADKPQQSIFSRTIDLSALGDRTYFGFRAAGADDGQYADLLSWTLQTTDHEAVEHETADHETVATDSAFSLNPVSLLETDAAPSSLAALTEISVGQPEAQLREQDRERAEWLADLGVLANHSAPTPKSVPEPGTGMLLAWMIVGFWLSLISNRIQVLRR